MNLFPATFHRLERSLDAATLKQKVISSNIANVDTPNYKAKEVVFQSELSKAMQKQLRLNSYRTHHKHIPFSTQTELLAQPSIVSRSHTLFNHNKNNVDLDYEMTELAKNQLWYNAVTERINGHFNGLRTVISEGR